MISAIAAMAGFLCELLAAARIAAGWVVGRGADCHGCGGWLALRPQARQITTGPMLGKVG
jgi:hypothetical protein